MTAVVLFVFGAGAGPTAAQDASTSGDAGFVKATVALVYQCKLVAEEGFIRRSATPEVGTAHPVIRCGGAEPLFPPAGDPGREITCDDVTNKLGKRVPESRVKVFEHRCRRVRQVERRATAFRRAGQENRPRPRPVSTQGGHAGSLP